MCARQTMTLWLMLLIAMPPAAGGDDTVSPGVARQDADGAAPQSGTLLLRMQEGYRSATGINTDISIRVGGTVARTTVSQAFRNDATEWVEALYVFPLPDSAAVDRLRIRAGERVIEGEIREKDQARREYRQARDRGQRAGLVEQRRSNLFSTAVANLGPGETMIVEIEYLETVAYADGTFSLRFPLTLTPRYIPGNPLPDRQGSGWSADTVQVPDASLITPPVVAASGDHKVTLHALIDAGVPLELITSRYHPVNITPVEAPAAGAAPRYQVSLRGDEVPMDHDLELTWRPDSDALPRATLFREDAHGASHYQLMLMPPAEMSDKLNAVPRTPRELLLIVDTSGSMHGTSIEQARQALLLALRGLEPRDRFDVVQFNSITHSLFSGSVEASPENVDRARRYVQAVEATGGTEMRPALELALRQDGPGEHLRQIIFITDGSVGNEAELFSLIEKELGSARLFTVGIGSAPNSWFMRKAAEAGRGTFTYISALHEVKEKMDRLFGKLEQPRLTGIEVEWPGAALAYPQPVTDLYAGEPVVQAVRLARAPRQGELVTVSGMSPMGGWQAELPLAIDRQSPGVAALWARARIEELLDRERQGEDGEAARQAVIDTALEHHLVSRYTSLMAVDKTPVRPRTSGIVRDEVPNLLPFGQSMDAIFAFPATATGWPRQVAVGALLLSLAPLVCLARRRFGHARSRC